MPVKAGIQKSLRKLDSRLRGNDEQYPDYALL
jgi:hypothetical protein